MQLLPSVAPSRLCERRPGIQNLRWDVKREHKKAFHTIRLGSLEPTDSCHSMPTSAVLTAAEPAAETAAAAADAAADAAAESAAAADAAAAAAAESAQSCAAVAALPTHIHDGLASLHSSASVAALATAAAPAPPRPACTPSPSTGARGVASAVRRLPSACRLCSSSSSAASSLA